MNFNKIFTGMAMVALATGFVACDDISEDDRVIPMERPTVKRTVLVQEFTGMRCTNCPDGAREVATIKEVYDVISVNMHPTGSTFTRPLGDLDLRSEEATEMYNYWRPTGFPAAVINGTAPNTSITQWMNVVDGFSKIASPLSIELTTNYDESSRKVDVDYEVAFNDIYADECSVMVWLTEDGIVGSQMTAATLLTEYVHNHVLRASLNGVWGETIGSGFIYDDTKTGTASMILNDAWVADNCDIVAFVFNTNTKEVLQVVKASVK